MSVKTLGHDYRLIVKRAMLHLHCSALHCSCQPSHSGLLLPAMWSVRLQLGVPRLKIDQKTNFSVHLITFSVILCHGSVRCPFHCSSALMPSALLQRRLAGRFQRCAVVAVMHAGLIYGAAFAWLRIRPSSYSVPLFSFDG